MIVQVSHVLVGADAPAGVDVVDAPVHVWLEEGFSSSHTWLAWGRTTQQKSCQDET